MNRKVTRPIIETKYLSVENAWRYRSIMRTFFIFDQQFRHWLSKEDIFSVLKCKEEFDGYTIEQCRQDLDSLVEWGNLTAVQDTSKVATYQQFVNKQFRYQMTEYSIEIERMTIRLENILIEGGSLESTLLERIKQEVKELRSMLDADDKTAGGWWSQLGADLQRLNQNYQDYIRDWYSAKSEELMKTKSFLVYKEKLVDYLRNFIKELQFHTHEIENILRGVEAKELEKLVEKISRYEYSIPRLDMEAVQYEEIRVNIAGKIESMLMFFVGGRRQAEDESAGESEVERILTMTNEVIRKITRYATNILELSSQYSNRKDEYKRIAELFLRCGNLQEAHLLAANVFGISSYKHFKGELTRETESIQSSIWDETPLQIHLEPRVRTYREKLAKTGIRDNSERKKQMREKILEERELQKMILNSYTALGRIDFKELRNVPQDVRRTMLRWLGKAIQEQGRTTVTEHGQKFKLLNPKETKRCRMHCEDGELDMPAFVLEFEQVVRA